LRLSGLNAGRNHMRILLIDDDVGDIIGAMLSKAGFSVEVVRDGDEAFRVYCEKGPFDVVLSDIRHPGLPADRLISRIHERNPKQAYGFLTGHPVLQKPFEAQQLLDFVGRLASSSDSSS